MADALVHALHHVLFARSKFSDGFMSELPILNDFTLTGAEFMDGVLRKPPITCQRGADI